MLQENKEQRSKKAEVFDNKSEAKDEDEDEDNTPILPTEILD